MRKNMGQKVDDCSGLGPRPPTLYCLLSFGVKKFFPFPLVTAKLIGDYFNNKGNAEADKFVSVIMHIAHWRTNSE